VAGKFSNDQHICNHIAFITKTAMFTFGKIYKHLYAEAVSIEELNLLYKAIALSNYFRTKIEHT
jgi:hypothetical protein